MLSFFAGLFLGMLLGWLTLGCLVHDEVRALVGRVLLVLARILAGTGPRHHALSVRCLAPQRPDHGDRWPRVGSLGAGSLPLVLSPSLLDGRSGSNPLPAG